MRRIITLLVVAVTVLGTRWPAAAAAAQPWHESIVITASDSCTGDPEIFGNLYIHGVYQLSGNENRTVQVYDIGYRFEGTSSGSDTTYVGAWRSGSVRTAAIDPSGTATITVVSSSVMIAKGVGGNEVASGVFHVTYANGVVTADVDRFTFGCRG